MARAPDIAIVSIGTTLGWRAADAALAGQIRAAGASCEIVPMRLGAAAGLQRTMAATDVVQALASRRAARRAAGARAVIYSSVTCSLLQPLRRPHAIRFDTTAALSRPGIGGAWQRRRERSVLRRADLLLPFSPSAADAAAQATGGPPQTIVLAAPFELAPEPASDAPDAVAYAANPDKRGLDVLCAAWAQAAPPGARLLVSGIDRGYALRFLGERGIAEPPGVEWSGAMSRSEWLATVAGARVAISAAKFEDWGMAQLEILAAGTPLATLPTPGPNPALPLARELAPELVAPAMDAAALAGAVRAALALDGPARAAYAAGARRLTEPYSDAALRVLVAERVLPALLN